MVDRVEARLLRSLLTWKPCDVPFRSVSSQVDDDSNEISRATYVKSVSLLWLVCSSFDICSSVLNLSIPGEAHLIPILDSWLIFCFCYRNA